jgi:predicted  nucleic acid-binding Zn-ribbon protein
MIAACLRCGTPYTRGDGCPNCGARSVHDRPTPDEADRRLGRVLRELLDAVPTGISVILHVGDDGLDVEDERGPRDGFEPFQVEPEPGDSLGDLLELALAEVLRWREARKDEPTGDGPTGDDTRGTDADY